MSFFSSPVGKEKRKKIKYVVGQENEAGEHQSKDMDFLSAWSEWSACSRTCGTGIQYRGRRCHSDRRACNIPRQYRTCNNELCPVNARDFRDVQCSEEDSRNKMIKGKKVKFKSIFRGMFKCALFCHPIGMRMSVFFGQVKDGTMCAKKPYSVCVEGECKQVGCDRVIGSDRTLDKCQVCGGNGSSCEAFSGMVDRKATPEEIKRGFAQLYVIPKYATTVLLNEPSTNYLAIKRENGEYVFNGNKTISSPGTYRIGKTDFKYSRPPNDAAEAVVIMGPTTEIYYVMSRLSSNDNVKSDYEYWLPKELPTTEPTTVHTTKTTTISTTSKVPETQFTTTKSIAKTINTMLSEKPTTAAAPENTKTAITTSSTTTKSSTAQRITTDHHIATKRIVYDNVVDFNFGGTRSTTKPRLTRIPRTTDAQSTKADDVFFGELKTTLITLTTQKSTTLRSSTSRPNVNNSEGNASYSGTTPPSSTPSDKKHLLIGTGNVTNSTIDKSTKHNIQSTKPELQTVSTTTPSTFSEKSVVNGYDKRNDTNETRENVVIPTTTASNATDKTKNIIITSPPLENPKINVTNETAETSTTTTHLSNQTGTTSEDRPTSSVNLTRWSNETLSPTSVNLTRWSNETLTPTKAFVKVTASQTDRAKNTTLTANFTELPNNSSETQQGLPTASIDNRQDSTTLPTTFTKTRSNHPTSSPTVPTTLKHAYLESATKIALGSSGSTRETPTTSMYDTNNENGTIQFSSGSTNITESTTTQRNFTINVNMANTVNETLNDTEYRNQATTTTSSTTTSHSIPSVRNNTDYQTRYSINATIHPTNSTETSTKYDQILNTNVTTNSKKVSIDSTMQPNTTHPSTMASTRAVTAPVADQNSTAEAASGSETKNSTNKDDSYNSTMKENTKKVILMEKDLSSTTNLMNTTAAPTITQNSTLNSSNTNEQTAKSPKHGFETNQTTDLNLNTTMNVSQDNSTESPVNHTTHEATGAHTITQNSTLNSSNTNEQTTQSSKHGFETNQTTDFTLNTTMSSANVSQDNSTESSVNQTTLTTLKQNATEISILNFTTAISTKSNTSTIPTAPSIFNRTTTFNSTEKPRSLITETQNTMHKNVTAQSNTTVQHTTVASQNNNRNMHFNETMRQNNTEKPTTESNSNFSHSTQVNTTVPTISYVNSTKAVFNSTLAKFNKSQVNTTAPTISNLNTANVIDSSSLGNHNKTQLNTTVPTMNYVTSTQTVLSSTSEDSNKSDVTTTISPISYNTTNIRNSTEASISTNTTKSNTSHTNPWGPWTTCSRTCGMGFKVRARPCNYSIDGPECLHKSTQISLCMVQPCKREPPSWSPWGTWTACSSSCGIGVRARIRTCRNSEVISTQRSECVGRRFEVELCRNATCGKQKQENTLTRASTFSVSPSLAPSPTIQKESTSSINKHRLPAKYQVSGISSSIKPTASVDPATHVSPSMKSCKDKHCLSTRAGIVSSFTSTPALSSIVTSFQGSTTSGSKSTISMQALPTSVGNQFVISSSTRKLDTSDVIKTLSTSKVAEILQASATLPLPFASISRQSSMSSSAQSLPSLDISRSSALSTSSSMHIFSTPSLTVEKIKRGTVKSSSSTYAQSTVPLRSSRVLHSSLPSMPTSPLLSLIPSSTVQYQLLKSSPSTYQAITSLSASTEVVMVTTPTATVKKLGSSSDEKVTSVLTIKPSVSVSKVVQASLNVSGESSSSCPPCSLSARKNVYCKSDYAIHVVVNKTYTNSNDRSMYLMNIVKTYKTTWKFPAKLSLRKLGGDCPCPNLLTGKHYVIFGKLKTKKGGKVRVMFNRRSFAREWSQEFEKEVSGLQRSCNVKTTVVTTNTVGSRSTMSPAALSETTTQPPTTARSTTVLPTTDPCPSCRLSDNLESILCTHDYAIHAKVAKYRHATNRTMYYAHVIKTYKTTHELPYEVLIRVPGQLCPCPPLEVGVEYLMVGSIKITYTGKQRLTLSINSFVKKWDDQLEQTIDHVKSKCGLPVVERTLTTLAPSTKPSTRQQTTEVSTTMQTSSNPSTMKLSTSTPRNVSCPGCRSSKISKTQQRKYCNSEEVFHGRVEKSFVTSGNRTQYVVNMLTSFKSTFEIPDRMKIRLADSACLCNQLSVGKEFLFMGRVKDKGDGKARMTLSRKSFVQRWDDSLYAAIDYVKAQCKSPLMEVKINKTTISEKTPVIRNSTTSQPIVPTTITTTTKGSCPHCRISYNIQDYCSNQHVLRVMVLKRYHTSSQRTIYHVSVSQVYKSPQATEPVILLRVPGVECHCPILRLGVEYVVMGLVTTRKRGTSIMKLSSGNFVQPWNEGFEEELQSLRLGCNGTAGSVAQFISGSKPAESDKTVPIKKPITIDMPTVTTTTDTKQPIVKTTVPMTTTLPTCPPCQLGKGRRKFYCTSDFVLAVQIQERVHNTSTHMTQYFATIQNTYKSDTPLDVLVAIAVPNDQCSCPNLEPNTSYILMASKEHLDGGKTRLVLPTTPFVKTWSVVLHKKIMKLKGSCSTGHKKL